MSNAFEPTHSMSQFKLPPQDIRVLSFCESDKPQKVRQWADALKMTQIKATAVEIYAALPEINHLQVDTKTRYEMLEILWPAVQDCLQGLVKEFLHQPITAPESVQKVALMAQALQKHLLDGYTVCVKELVAEVRLKPALQDLLLNCIVRALSSSGLLLLRSSQLYLQAPPQFWERVHALFRIAEYYDLHNRPSQGADGKPGRTVQQAYTHLVVFSSIRPNQLSQNDLFQAFKALEVWARNVKLLPSATTNPNNLYLVDLDQDTGAIPKARFDGSPEHRVLELDFQPLLALLNKMSQGRNERHTSGSNLSVPAEVPAVLLESMLDCWSNAPQRNIDRRPTDIQAEACFGLTDCHYHLCGNIEFEEFIRPKESAKSDSFLTGGIEALIGAMSGKKEEEAPKAPKRTVFDISLKNSSAGGYCVYWLGGLPTRVESGELIGIREHGRRSWNIGIIRWIRQLKTSSQLGVQLLSTQPVPYGAAIRYDMGGYSDFMRAIHIPKPIMHESPPLLLTAAVPFQTNSQVRLKQDTGITDVRFTQGFLSTNKVKLFRFEVLNEKNDR